MPMVYEETLKKQIATKKLQGTYMLCGDDSYLKDMYMDKLIRLVTDKDDVFNFHRFTGNCDFGAVYDAAVQFPMMADKKCIVIKDYDFEMAEKPDFDRFVEIIIEDYETAIIIVAFEAINIDYKKSSRFKKLVSAVEKSGGMAAMLNHRSKYELTKMLVDGARKRGSNLDSVVAGFMLNMVGEDIQTLVNELNKLCCYAKSEKITKEMVERVCVKSVEASVFELTDKILSSKIDEAVRIVDELYFSRVEPIIILHTIASFYVDMYRAYCAKKHSIPAGTAIEAFKYGNKDFVYRRAADALSKFNLSKLCLSLEAVLEAEKAIKGFTKDTKTVIEQLIVRLVYIIARGQSID